jgi:hypothetical protein
LHPVMACLCSGAMLFFLLPLCASIENTHRIWMACILAATGGLYLLMSALLLWLSGGIQAEEKQWLLQQFRKINRRNRK